MVRGARGRADRAPGRHRRWRGRSRRSRRCDRGVPAIAARNHSARSVRNVSRYGDRSSAISSTSAPASLRPKAAARQRVSIDGSTPIAGDVGAVGYPHAGVRAAHSAAATKSRPRAEDCQRRAGRRAGHHLQHQRDVLDGARHRAGDRERVPDPVHRVLRHEAGRRTQADHAAERRRQAQRSAEVGAVGQRDHAGGQGRGAAAGRSAGRSAPDSTDCAWARTRCSRCWRRRRTPARWSCPARWRPRRAGAARRRRRRRARGRRRWASRRWCAGRPSAVTSLMPTGTPASSPAGSPASSRASSARASSSARGFSVTTAFTRRVPLGHARQRGRHHVFGAAPPGGDVAGDGGGGQRHGRRIIPWSSRGTFGPGATVSSHTGYIHSGYSDAWTTRLPTTLLPLPPATFHILLAVADDDRHGYAIIQEVAARTGGEVRLSAGTLYRSIQRMVEQDLIEETDRAAGARSSTTSGAATTASRTFGRDGRLRRGRAAAGAGAHGARQRRGAAEGLMRAYRLLLRLYPAALRDGVRRRAGGHASPASWRRPAGRARRGLVARRRSPTSSTNAARAHARA